MGAGYINGSIWGETQSHPALVWYGNSKAKEGYDKWVGSKIATGLSNNYGQAIQKSDNIFSLQGVAPGPSFASWDTDKQNPYIKGWAGINPTTVAAGNAIANAMMGLLASEDFYLWMLSSGYVYLDQYAGASYNLQAVTKEEGIIPSSVWFQKAIKFILEDKNFPITGQPDDPEILPPEKYPPYGTSYTPHMWGSGNTQGNDNVPSWIVGNWSTIHQDDFTTKYFGKTTKAPIYRANFDINAKEFIKEYLLGHFVKEDHNAALTKLAQWMGFSQGSQGSSVDGAGADPLQIPVLGATSAPEYLSKIKKMLGTVGSATAGALNVSTMADGLAILENATKIEADLISTAVTSVLEEGWATFFQDYILATTLASTEEDFQDPLGIQNAHPFATHYVALQGTTGKPPVPITSAEVKKRPHGGKIVKAVGTLNGGTAVRVKKEFIGHKGEWHQISVISDSPLKDLNMSLYIKSKFLKKLPKTPPSLGRTDKCKPSDKSAIPDWTKMEDGETFIDRKSCDYCIVVEPVDPLTDMKYKKILGDHALAEMKQGALPMGVEALLKFYNKEMNLDVTTSSGDVKATLSSTMLKILGAFKGPYIRPDEWHLDKRPKSKVKILVRFPARYFDALPQTPEDFRGIAHISTQTLKFEGSVEEISFEKDIPSLRTVHFVLPTLVEKIKIISDLLEFYANKIDKWDGDITGFDIRKEKTRLENFPVVLTQFMKLNGFTPEEKNEDTIELGFSGAFALEYILLNKTGFSAPLRIGFDQFKNKEPINIGRTMGYIFYLDELVREARRKIRRPWIDFVQKYTFPVPEIRPSSISKDAALANPSVKGGKKKAAEKIAQKYDDIEVTTSAEKIEIDKKLDNIQLKIELADIRKIEEDFVGDEFVRQIPQLLKKLEGMACGKETLDELYSSVLNKVDITALADMAASVESAQMPSIDVTTALSEYALDQMTIPQVEDVYNALPTNIQALVDIQLPAIELELPEAPPFQSDIMSNSEIDTERLGLDAKFARPAAKIKKALENLSNLSLDGITAADFEIDVDVLPIPVDIMEKLKEIEQLIENLKNATLSVVGDAEDALQKAKEEKDKALKDLEAQKKKLLASIPNSLPSGLSAKLSELDLPIDFDYSILLEQDWSNIEKFAEDTLVNAVRDVAPDFDFDLPSVPSMPDTPSLPTIPDAPALPSLPAIPEVPSLPAVPSITIPPVGDGLMKIVDTMSDVATDLQTQIEEMTCSALMETVKLTLEGVFEGVFSSAGKSNIAKSKSNPAKEYGGKNLNNMFSPARGGLEEALSEMGLPSDLFLEHDPSNTPEEDPAVQGSAKTMIDDISAILTPLELVDLLEGNAVPEVEKIVKNLINHSYPSYLEHITETTNISDVFQNLGNFVDKNLRDSIRAAAESFPEAMTGLLCEDDDEDDNIVREQLLVGRLDKKRITQQRKKVRRRRRKKFKKLLKLSKKPDRILKEAFPPPTRKGGSPIDECAPGVGNPNDSAPNNVVAGGFGGIIPQNHPSLDYLNDKVIKNIFDPPSAFFNTDAGSYVDSLIINTFSNPSLYDEEFKPLKQELKGNGWTDTAIELALIGQFDEDKAKAEEQRSQFLSVAAKYQKTNSRVAPKVRDNFLNIDVTTLGSKFPPPRYHSMNLKVKTYDAAKINMNVYDAANTEYDKALKEIEDIDKTIKSLKDTAEDSGGPGPQPKIDYLEKKKAEAKELANTAGLAKEAAAEKSKDQAALFLEGEQSSIDEQTIDINLLYKSSQTSKATPVSDRFKEDISTLSFDKYSALKGVQINVSSSVPPFPEAATYVIHETGSWQQEGFANYAIDRWDEAIEMTGLQPEVNLKAPGSKIFDYYMGKHPLLFAKLLRNFASVVAQSPLFEVEKLEDIQLNKDDDYPRNGGLCPSEGLPDLLDIKNTQQAVREIYNMSCEDPQQDFSQPGALESSGIQGLVYTTIRVNVLEVILKSIFVFSRFSVEESLGDKLLTDFIMEMTISGLRSQGNEYFEEFRKQTKLVTDNRQKQGEKLTNPFGREGKNGPPDETLGDPEDPSTLSGESSMKFLIKEQIKSVSQEIVKRLEPDIKDINKKAFFDRIPTIDSPKSWQHNRFEEVILTSTTFGAQKGTIWEKDDSYEWGKTHLKEGFEFLSNLVDSGAGGFYLEKYIRVKDKDLFDYGNATFLEQEFWDSIWTFRAGGKENLYKQKYGTYQGTFIIDPEVDAHLSGVVNRKAFRAFLISWQDDYGEIDLNKFLANFKFGLRLCYVPPTDSLSALDANYLAEAQAKHTQSKHQILDVVEQLLETTPGGGQFQSQGTGLTIPDDYSTLYNKYGGGPLEQVCILEKTYQLVEHIETIDKSPNTPDTLMVALRKRGVYPIPLISVEKSFGLDGVDPLSLANLAGALSDTATELNYNQLQYDMIKTEEYQFLFNYIFSLPRMLSLLSAYNTISTSENVEGAENVFEMTKRSLKSMFNSLIPGDPWYSKQDETLEAMGGNLGMMQKDNDSMTMDGPTSNPSYAKIASQASVILIKGIARMQDPHYSFVSMLDRVGAAPFGMTWGSVPVFWPVNFPFVPPIPGWGPVLTPLGMVAYSAGLLSGEKKKKRNRKAALVKNAAKEENIKCPDHELSENPNTPWPEAPIVEGTPEKGAADEGPKPF